jgi:hypothetical protein
MIARCTIEVRRAFPVNRRRYRRQPGLWCAMYKIVAHFDRGPATYTATSEEDALEMMDKLLEGEVRFDVTDDDGNPVDENELTDRIDARDADRR